MKSIKSATSGIFLIFILLSGMIFCPETLLASSAAKVSSPSDSAGFVLYKGRVVDRKSGDPLAFASIMLNGSNISTITNTEGSFSLKVPSDKLNGEITVSFLGYGNKLYKLVNFNPESCLLELDELTVLLPEVSVVFSDAASLIDAVLKKKGDNYLNKSAQTTAFYRETIKKRKTYVSLLEAVVDIDKTPYSSPKNDGTSLFKARKNTDYQKLDTLVFKLMGGPYNTLYADVMKRSDVFFDKEVMKSYEFSFDPSTRIGDKLVYVVNFKPHSGVTEPLYYGKLYVDAQSLALVSAVYGMTLENRDAAAEIFIKRKPVKADVYPTRFTARADYLQKNGKWYLSYSRVELDVNVNWKRRLFNTLYESTMEMAVTDWTTTASLPGDHLISKSKLKTNVIVSDEAAGFSDPAFWGEYNVIEPEKSIQTAIKKIQKQLRKAITR